MNSCVLNCFSSPKFNHEVVCSVIDLIIFRSCGCSVKQRQEQSYRISWLHHSFTYLIYVIEHQRALDISRNGLYVIDLLTVVSHICWYLSSTLPSSIWAIKICGWTFWLPNNIQWEVNVGIGQYTTFQFLFIRMSERTKRRNIRIPEQYDYNAQSLVYF